MKKVMASVVDSSWFVVKAGIAVFILLVTLSHEPVTAYAAGATLSVQPGAGTFNRSCPFSLDVFLDTGGALTDGTDAILFYDPTRFTAQKIRPGTIYADYPGLVIDSQKGKIAVSGISSLSSSFAGQGVLASIDFIVAAEAPVGATQITFDFDAADKAKTTDSNVAERGTVAEILSQVNNGSYAVGTGACGALPTPTPAGKGGPGDGKIAPTGTLSPGGKEPGIITPTIILGAVGVMMVVLGAIGLARR